MGKRISRKGMGFSTRNRPRKAVRLKLRKLKYLNIARIPTLATRLRSNNRFRRLPSAMWIYIPAK
jgi:hypothetical protein